MTPDADTAALRQLSLPALFLKFLRFGLLAFGGPVAQIAMVRQVLIEDESWISRERFNRLLAVMQILPGPEAHELCVHLGMVARGRWGGLLAGLGFMLPGFALMLGCAWAYAHFVAGEPMFAGVLIGLQAVVLAAIVRAIPRIAGHILIDRTLIALATVSAAATLVGVPFWVPLLAAGVAYALGLSLVAATLGAAAPAAIIWGLAGAGGVVLAPVPPAIAAQAGTLALFVAGLKGGLLTFGGAYTAIPYIRADTVGRGWIADGTFLDGVAIAGVLPAPLVIFATFVGYVAGGWAGAVAMTAGMFLPAFAFSMIFFERLEAIVENARLHRLLDGVAAAVVGIIAATCVQLGVTLLLRTPAIPAVLAIFAVGLIGIWRWKSRLAMPVLLLVGGCAGWQLVR